LLIDILTNVNEISNVVLENVSKIRFGESSTPATNVGYLRMHYRNIYPNLGRQGLEELAQVTSITARLVQKINLAFDFVAKCFFHVRFLTHNQERVIH
jgi:hypothetical protein